MRKSHLYLSLFALLAMALIATVFVSGVSAGRETFPPIIHLPDNFNPEGVVTGRGPVIYAGSLANGAIYKANLRTGEGEILVDGQDGTLAVGLAFDARSNYLFVSGGFGGTVKVYDAASGTLVETYLLTDPTNGPFINDGFVARDAAYFTNSFAEEFYRLPLGPAGELPGQGAVETIPLGGEFEFEPGAFNANGVEASQDGRHLLIVNTWAEKLYRVDPISGEAIEVDLGGVPLTNGDGLVLIGRTLYVVQNFINRVAEIQLADDFLSGQVTDTITDPDFRVPTTAADFGSYLYAVNARFGQDTGADPTFEIVQVKR